MSAVWNMLTLEQLRQLSDKQVTQLVNDRLIPFGAPTHLALVQPADFLAAQYYVNELERREKRRADEARDAIETQHWRIDLRYERLIVVLIILEVILAAGLTWWTDDRQSRSAQMEFEALQSVQQVLTHLEASSEDTAAAINEERQTMEAMNTALQRQLALFYDVSVTTIYSSTDKRLSVANMGRTNVVIGGIKIANVVALTIPEGRVLTPQSTFNADLAATSAYDFIVRQAVQDKDGLTPFDVYVTNERQEEFVIHAYFVVKDKAIINVQAGSISPQHWSGKKK